MTNTEYLSLNNNNNEKRIPLWLQEIIDNGDQTSSFNIFTPDCLFASCSTNSNSKIQLHYSFDKNKIESLNKKRTAFFFDGPFLESNSTAGTTGAIASVLGMMEALAESGFDVFLFYCFRGWSNPELYPGRKFSTVFIKPEDFYDNHSMLINLVKFFGISFCHFDSAEPMNWQAPFLKPYAKIVFEVHNVQHSLLAQTGAPKDIIEYIKVLETKAIEIADVMLLRSATDMEKMKQLNSKNSHMYLYRGCITVADSANLGELKATTGNIVFMGHLNYEPNIQALDLIAKHIAPNLEGQCFIVGLCSKSLQKRYSSHKNMIFMNWVENLNEIFSNVDIALAPIISGSGTAMKVLEYMAHHLPVIATSMACRGLEDEINEAVIIENDIKKYPKIIEALLKQPKLMNKYGNLGCEFVRKYRDWKVGIVDVLTAYDSLMAQNDQIWLSLEGMPRAGKSTTLKGLVDDRNFDVCTFDEIFFTKEYSETRKDLKETIDDSKWFLNREADRQKVSTTSPFIVTDRCYLSTLAYSYALAIHKNDPDEFEKVLEYFNLHKSEYPHYKIIFVYDTDPVTTFERREERDAPHNIMWMNKEFMENYRKFYQHEIHKYTNAKIIRISSNTSLDDAYSTVERTLKALMNPLISVILCCHNDEAGISTTLKALEHQTMAKEKFEIIVVDNASTPSLKNFITKFSKKSPLIIRYIYENRLGLSIARNTGISIAKSKFIAVTDPENVPDPKWLEKIGKTFEENPDAIFVGGKLINNVNGKIPWYFPEKLTEYFTPVIWPEKLTPIAYPYFATGVENFIGANMAFQKSAFQQVHGFNKNLGRTGKKLLSCEDIEFKIKLQKEYCSDKCLIQPNAIVCHITENTMFGFKNLMRRAYWQGVSEARMSKAIEENENAYNNRSLEELAKNGAKMFFNFVLLNIEECVYNLFFVVLNFGYLYTFFIDNSSTVVTKKNIQNICNQNFCRFKKFFE